MDNISGIEHNMQSLSGLNLTTESKGTFSSNYNSPIGIYPLIGEPRYTILIHYGSLNEVGDVSNLPETFQLHQNYPNPFNPITRINYELPISSKVKIHIHDITGKLVLTILDEFKPPGYWQVLWDGKNKDGKTVSSGMYIYTIKTKGFTQSKKLCFTK
tara:strand:+ start:73 stop:546 length:474 start_codon:yes stop_codon:yes gene_type:complete